MIDIRQLSQADLGRWVIYRDGAGHTERGRIKSWSANWIYVVYRCLDDWDNYQKYTGLGTAPKDLQFEED